jgi:hypothetical protein
VAADAGAVELAERAREQWFTSAARRVRGHVVERQKPIRL